VVTVAVHWILFTAHDRNAVFRRQFDQFPESSQIPRPRVNYSIVDQFKEVGLRRRQFTVLVTRRVRSTAAQAFAKKDIVDPNVAERLSQGLAVELRRKSAMRIGPDIHDSLNEVRVKVGDKIVSSKVAVADREDLNCVVFFFHSNHPREKK
jgi:hypothetical protein